MSAKRQAEECLNVLKQLEATRGNDYVWTANELAQVAPYYHGSPKKFNLSIYIQNVITRTRVLHEEPSQPSTSRFNIIDDELPSLETAVMQIFHAICPHPIRYYNEEGVIDFDEYKKDLGIWLTTISTTWINMQATQHQDDCSCCINFRMLATNYEDMLKTLMQSEDYNLKRVSKNTIRRWAAGLASDGAKEGLSNLVKIGKALLSGADDSMISELTDLSSELSDADEDEPSIPTYITETTKGNLRYEERIDPNTESEIETTRIRKLATRPLDTIIEVSDKGEVLTLAITELNVMVHVKIPSQNLTHIGRNEICEYAKTFFSQLIKVKATLSILDMLGDERRLRKINKMHKAYQGEVGRLKMYLSGRQTVYTTRSRKEIRRRMLLANNK